MRVGDNNTQQWSWDWLRGDETMLLIVTSIMDTTILLIIYSAISSFPEPSRSIREHWGCREQSIGEKGPHSHEVTPIFGNNSAARWVMAAMNLNNLKLFHVIHRGQQANSIPCHELHISSGCSYHAPDVNLSPPAKDIIDNIGDNSNDDPVMHHPNQRSFPTMKRGIHKVELKLHRRGFRQMQFLEGIRNHALGHFSNHKQQVTVEKVVAALRNQDHIVNPPTANSLANRKRTSSRPTANQSLSGRNALAQNLFKDLHCRWVLFLHCGGWTDEG